jgi:hypothetical protein
VTIPAIPRFRPASDVDGARVWPLASLSEAALFDAFETLLLHDRPLTPPVLMIFLYIILTISEQKAGCQGRSGRLTAA